MPLIPSMVTIRGPSPKACNESNNDNVAILIKISPFLYLSVLIILQWGGSYIVWVQMIYLCEINSRSVVFFIQSPILLYMTPTKNQKRISRLRQKRCFHWPCWEALLHYCNMSWMSGNAQEVTAKQTYAIDCNFDHKVTRIYRKTTSKLYLCLYFPYTLFCSVFH